eukprot:14407978-Alexandrium_andersonii.AAC.1
MSAHSFGPPGLEPHESVTRLDTAGSSDSAPSAARTAASAGTGACTAGATGTACAFGGATVAAAPPSFAFQDRDRAWVPLPFPRP